MDFDCGISSSLVGTGVGRGFQSIAFKRLGSLGEWVRQDPEDPKDGTQKGDSTRPTIGTASNSNDTDVYTMTRWAAASP